MAKSDYFEQIGQANKFLARLDYVVYTSLIIMALLILWGFYKLGAAIMGF